MTRKQWIAAIIWTTLSALIIPAAIVYGAEVQDYHTGYTTIRLNTPTDLINFNRSISGLGYFTFLSKKPAWERVNEIYLQVIIILGMEKGSYPLLVIDISHDKETLLKIWNRGRKVADTKAPLAFYGNGTIYSHIDDINRGRLAHEMAHHIIDTYLLVRPPSKTAEILAQHVEKML